MAAQKTSSCVGIYNFISCVVFQSIDAVDAFKRSFKEKSI